IVGQHVIFGHSLDTSTLYDGRRLTMSEDNITVSVVHIYLETTDKKIRSKIHVADIGVTNGVVHLLDNLLSVNFTIWEAMSDIPALKHLFLCCTFRRIYDVIGTSTGDLKQTLNKESDILTAFLPSNTVFDEHYDIITSMMTHDPDAFLKVGGELTVYDGSVSVIVTLFFT
ncbi:unnamed protein product, partial [Candidula unifasciata]